MAVDRHGESSVGVLDVLVTTGEGKPHIQTNNADLFSEMLDKIRLEEQVGTLRCLTTEDVFEEFSNWTPQAFILSEFISNGHLRVKTVNSDDPLSNYFIDDSQAAMFVETTGDYVKVDVLDPETREELLDGFEYRWRRSTEREPPAPTLSRVVVSAKDSVSTEFADSLETDMYKLQHNNSQGELITVVLLLAAKHGEMLQDIYEWTEGLSLATQGTVSKFKLDLSEKGFIHTEQVSDGIGRPPQKLSLTEEWADTDIISILREYQSRSDE